MHRSRYENRAKWLSHNWRTGAKKTQLLPPDVTPAQYWSDHVKTKADVITYYQLFHPELGDQVIRALAENIQNAVEGKHILEEHWYTKEARQKLIPTNLNQGHEKVEDDEEWDFMAEIQRERMIALAVQPEQEESAGNWTGKQV